MSQIQFQVLGEYNRTKLKSFPCEAYILMVKTVNKKLTSKLHGILDGDECSGKNKNRDRGRDFRDIVVVGR